MTMNVIIIGCGYAGMAIARNWHGQQGYRVTVTTTTPDRVTDLAEVAQQVIVVKGSDDKLGCFLQHQDAVVLSMAPLGSEQVDADAYKDTYLQTAVRLVAALPSAPTVRQIIYLSSCAVYGKGDGGWVDETSPTAPTSPHAKILQETEQVLLSVASPTLQVCIFRLGGIYGVGREVKERFGDLAGTTRPGTGDYFTNWIQLDDIVSATEFALTHRLSGIYNLVNDVPIIVRDLFERMCERYSLPPVKWDASEPTTRSNNRRVSNQKLKAEGYQLIHPELEI